MAKVRLDDVYNEIEDDCDDNLSGGLVRTKKKKNPMKESDDISKKRLNKSKTCKIKKNRKMKEDYE